MTLLNNNGYDGTVKSSKTCPSMASDDKLDMLISSYKEDDTRHSVVSEFLERLLFLAFEKNVSDIHIEPFENVSKVRMRTDGMLIPFSEIPIDLHVKLISCIKVKAALNIAEKRLPQDGHFKIWIDGVSVNVRVSTMAAVSGEKAVMRILSDNAVIDNRNYFGMSAENYKRFIPLLNLSGSAIYFSGPTGSGKSTTLYMLLEALASENINICTIEDPVEKSIFGINQMQINNIAGLTFETGLKAILRQDPDVIMVGETRDLQTAEISARAAMTGHLVLSTLHTKSAAESFLRLKDMGMEPYMISACVAGCVSQRLLRKVCPDCRKTIAVGQENELLSSYGIREVSEGEGCEKCHYTGYSGRVAVHEVLVKDENISKMIYCGADVSEIEKYAEEHGMITLKSSAAKLLRAGIISEREFRRVLY